MAPDRSPDQAPIEERAGSDANAGSAGQLDFDAVYRRHFDTVCRWLAALAGPGIDVEDLAQEVFIVVRRKLGGFEGDDPRAWLYGIAAKVARSERRRAWFRRVVLGRSETDPDELLHAGDGPEGEIERRQRAEILYAMLSELSEKRRSAFILFEIMGYEAEEIAHLEGIPAATVRTRVHHARLDLAALAKRRRAREEAA